MTIHKLKTLPHHFQAIKDGFKTFEIRINDRNFQIGDLLTLEEYDTEGGYTEEITAEVIYILDELPYVPEGYVAMAQSADGVD